MKQPAAVVGVGQTRHRSKRTDVSIAGLCREAADRAVSIRRLGSQQQTVMPLDRALAMLADEAVAPDVRRLKQAA